jgi:hypothetical protein
MISPLCFYETDCASLGRGASAGHLLVQMRQAVIRAKQFSDLIVQPSPSVFPLRIVSQFLARQRNREHMCTWKSKNGQQSGIRQAPHGISGGQRPCADANHLLTDVLAPGDGAALRRLALTV